MGISIESRRGRVALAVAHCAGMIDLVALPVWVGTLIAQYRFDPQRAGGVVTLFLAGVVLASVVLAPVFNRVSGRVVATLGYALAAAGFVLAAGAGDFAPLAALHGLTGIAVGAALSVTHGTIARSARPHRMFALVSVALGVFAVVFLGATPQIVAAAGGPALFLVFGGVMALAALAALLAFPSAPPVRVAVAGPAVALRMPRRVWFGIAGIAGMTVVQAMTFSFLERAGADQGFARESINAVLIALGLVNLLPAALAALLERRLNARGVLMTGPVLQALLAATIMLSTSFAPYAAAASVFAAVMIFTHTFAFGVLARLEPSGRALAATPAMLMAGSAVGPLLGGTLVKTFGYGSVGVAAACVAAVAVYCFSRLPVTIAAEPTREALA